MIRARRVLYFLADLVFPTALYYGLRAGGVGIYLTLVISSLAPAAVGVYRLVRERRVDGLALYNARPDKGYSLTDCISMEAMRREGINQALTNDRHFEQEGFRALFRDA